MDFVLTENEEGHILAGGYVINDRLLIPSMSGGKNDDDEDSTGTPTTVLGVGMLVIAQVFSAMQNVVQEKIFDSYDVHPLEATGIEGVAGFTITSILLFVLNIFNYFFFLILKLLLRC